MSTSQQKEIFPITPSKIFKNELLSEWAQKDMFTIKTTFPFSANYKIYLDYIHDIHISQHHISSFISYIDNFINNCLKLGYFLYLSEKMMFPIKKLSLISCFSQYGFNDAKRDISMRLHTDGDTKINFNMFSVKHKQKSFFSLEILTQRALPAELYETAGFVQSYSRREKYGYNVSYCPVDNKPFIPLYVALPLFVNTPYLCEYVRHVLENYPEPVEPELITKHDGFKYLI